MTATDLMLAIRQVKKYRLHTFINVFCLSIGLAAGALAVMFITDELSFDKFHSKADRIFRLNKVNLDPNGNTSLTAETSGLMGPTMADEFPEIESFTRYFTWHNDVVFSYEDKNVLIKQRDLVFVDSSFLTVFDFPLISGDPTTALRNPRSIVITEKVANILFGNEDPVGKTIKGLQDLEYVVTGIVSEAPRNSHMQFAALMSWTTTVPETGPLAIPFLNNWLAQALTTYVLLYDQADHASVEAKLPKFMADHMPTRMDKYKLYLQPFRELYLRSFNVQGLKMHRMGSLQFNYFFSIIAGFVLFLACINYINISTSKATRRAREVAMRKTLGATKQQLIFQFLGESFVLVLCAALLAFVLLILAIPYFNELTGKMLPLSMLNDRAVILSGIALTLFVSVASGVYPGFVLSSFAPAFVRGSGKARISGNLPRQVLIVFQFVITTCLTAGTLLIYQQITLVLSAEVGFDKDHLLLVTMTDDVLAKKDVMIADAQALPNVISVSASQTTIGLGTYSTYVIPEGFNPDEIEARVFHVDGNYLRTYGLEIADGRFFDTRLSTDSAAVIINETMMKKLQWNNPTEKTIKFNERSPALPVIGVLKDFHFKSFYEAIEPLVMVLSPMNQRNLAVRFSGDPSDIVSTLEKDWKAVESRYPFDYTFVDEAFARAYEAEQKLLETVLTFACLSIVIACLGLYGLVSFTVEQRIKEFGIRKVLGATVAQISYLVNKKFLFLASAGAIIGVPIVVPFIDQWLGKFALKITVTPVAFLLSLGIILFVTLLAVSVQTIKAGLSNPVQSLRHE